MRLERAEQTRRLEAHALDVLVALGERDAAVAAAELRAGMALWAMTQDGLSLRQAAEWCGETLTFRKATRLRRWVEGAANGQAARFNGPISVSDSEVSVP